MYSDNGSQLVRASKELKGAIEGLDGERLRGERNGVEFHTGGCSLDERGYRVLSEICEICETNVKYDCGGASHRRNKGYKYLLTVIDAFSKYGWIVPLETKTGKEVALAFRKLFLANTAPSRLWADKGTELYNQQLKAILAANNFTFYSTEDEEKSSIVERWDRTMKNIPWKYFTANNTHKYIDVLPSMVEKYNNTYH